MFIGSVPRQSVQQIFEVVALEQTARAYVLCSGQFRIESALRARAPDLWISGNDVSLLSCTLGRWLSGSTQPFRFVGDLAFLEELAPDPAPRARLAALLFALDYCAFKDTHAFGQRQRAALRNQAPALLAALDRKLDRYAEVRLDDFFAGDLRDQARRALEAGGLILTFTPTYKGGYERAYRALMQHVEWDPPPYALWDNAQLPDLIRQIEREGGRYCSYCDYPIDGLTPVAKFDRGRGHGIWLYSNAVRRHSLRAEGLKTRPFVYQPVDPAALTPDTPVRAVGIDSQRFNFLRERYLARHIEFTNGSGAFLILLGDRVAGGIAYVPGKFGVLQELYLLSDFSIVREGRIAKLIALLATSRELTRQLERTYGHRFTTIATTAFTDKPVSMKYRGVFTVSSRKPGMVNYVSPVRPAGLQDLYTDWSKRHAQHAH